MKDDILQRLAALDLGDVRIGPQHVRPDGFTSIAAFTMLVDQTMRHFSNNVLRTGWLHIDRLGQTGFVVDLRVHQMRALRLGDPVGLEFRILDVDDKRWHALTVMRHRDEGWVAAMQEQINLCVDFASRRAAKWHPETQANLETLHALYADQPWPEGFNRSLSLAALETA